jgi:rhodanese-related sulfurtransferase
MTRKHRKSKQTNVRSDTLRRHKLRKRNLTLVWIGVAALIIILAGGILFLPKHSPVTEITPIEAYAKLQLGAFFLDVRSQEEWDESRIAGSTLIPLDQLQDRVDELPKDKDIVVVCRSGRRSQSGASILQKAGFTRIASLSGGLNAWSDANYPIEQGMPSSPGN